MQRRPRRAVDLIWSPHPADTGLDFIENKQQAVPVTKRAQAAQESRRNGADAALSHDWFDQDRAGFRPDRLLDGFEICHWNLVEPLDLRAKAFKIFGLTAGCDCRQGAAVECALEGDETIAFGMAGNRLVFARHFDRGFVRLGARIRKED